jgi:hypothetical protein
MIEHIVLPINCHGVGDKTYNADGMLKHHFWGEYCADIILLFNSNEDAKGALPAITASMDPIKEKHTDAQGHKVISKGWEIGKEATDCIFIQASGDDLENALDVLENFGANRDKVTSMSKSIDQGEAFKIKIPHLYLDHPQQTTINYEPTST